MSYILKNNVSFINTKITDIGRKKLSEGRLTFTYFRLGDSEVCYDCEENKTDYSDQFIFKPKDDNGDIKYPIPLDAALPTNTFNLINGLNSVENIIYNSGDTRGFFSGTTNLLIKPTLFKALATGITTTNSLIVSAYTTSYNVGSNYTITSGDTILIKFNNSGSYLNFTGNSPSLFYQITSGSSIAFSAATGSTPAIFTIDRVPYTGTSVQLYFLPGGDAINNYYGASTPIPYWDETTLTFQNNNTTSNVAVDVWNLNIPRTETILGTPSSGCDYTYYGSKEYFGSKEYLGYGSENPEQKSVAIIHYTNNTINNFYGEQFYSNTAVLDMPRIFYHKTNQTLTPTAGTRFTCGTNLKTILSPVDNNVVLEYYDLIDSASNIIGKVFPKLKIFVIEDEEIVAVMDYKSNRNWTLQEPTLSLTTPSGASGLIENPTEQLWVSYMLTNSGTTGSLPCQKYQTITNLVGQRDIRINFPAFSFPFLNTGFVATNIFVLLQKTNIGERPKPENWRVIDCTSKISSFTTPGILSYQDLENTTFTISASEYNAATTPFNINNYINLPTPAQSTILNFGDQNFFFGNVSTSIQATTYTSLFTFIIDGDKFNTSLNPTFRSDIDNVKFTEVGIYDDEFNLVGIAKMASPIERAKNGGVNVLQISVDF